MPAAGAAAHAAHPQAHAPRSCVQPPLPPLQEEILCIAIAMHCYCYILLFQPQSIARRKVAIGKGRTERHPLSSEGVHNIKIFLLLSKGAAVPSNA